jgi:two-component system chemotaxis response regulator CheY
MHHILVVEDEPVLRELIARELTKQGYVVTVAPDGHAARDVLTTGTEVDLIMTDLLMPVMNGYDLLRDIRTLPHCKDVPVIVLSNSGQTNDLHRAYTLGATDVLIKAEFTPEQLITKVREQLRATVS